MSKLQKLTRSTQIYGLSLGQTSLQEWHTRTKVRQSIHPVGNLLAAQDLRQGTGKVVAVVVHQVVAIAAKLVAQLLHNPSNLLRRKVGAANLYALPEAKLLAQLVMVARLNLKDTGEGKGVAAVRVLLAKDLHARVEHAQADRRCIIVDPILCVEKRDKKREGKIYISQLLFLFLQGLLISLAGVEFIFRTCLLHLYHQVLLYVLNTSNDRIMHVGTVRVCI